MSSGRTEADDDDNNKQSGHTHAIFRIRRSFQGAVLQAGMSSKQFESASSRCTSGTAKRRINDSPVRCSTQGCQLGRFGLSLQFSGQIKAKCESHQLFLFGRKTRALSFNRMECYFAKKITRSYLSGYPVFCRNSGKSEKSRRIPAFWQPYIRYPHAGSDKPHSAKSPKAVAGTAQCLGDARLEAS